MRLSHTFILTSLVASTAVARHHPRKSHQNTLHSRHSRDLIDLCVALDASLVANVLQLVGLDTKANLCLCLHDLDIMLETDATIQAQIAQKDLEGKDGKTEVDAHLRAQLGQWGKSCKPLPPHAHRLHACGGDPCRYECDPPFVVKTTTGQCLCPPGTVECHGKCAKACSSSVPRSLKPRQLFVTSLEQAQSTCKPGEIVCGIPGSEGFECINVSNQLDSCGGCMVHHPWALPSAPKPSGRDCNDMSSTGAIDFSCRAGRCVASSCHSGFKVKNQQCVSVFRSRALDIGLDILTGPSSVASLVHLSLGHFRGLEDAINLLVSSCDCNPDSSSSSQHDQIIGNIVDLTFQLSSKSVALLTHPSSCDDLVSLIAPLVDEIEAALNLSDLTPAEVKALQALDLNLDLVNISLNKLTDSLLACGCKDEPSLMKALNALIPDPTVNSILASLYKHREFGRQTYPEGGRVVDSRRSLNPGSGPKIGRSPLDVDANVAGIDAKVTLDLGLGNLLGLGSSAATVDDIVDSTAKLLQLNLDLNIKVQGLANATSCDQSSTSPLSQCVADLVSVVNQIHLDSLTCLDSLNDLIPQLKAALPPCLDLDLGADLKGLLTDTQGSILDLSNLVDETLNLLKTCGCQNDASLIQMTNSLLAGLGLKRRAVVDGCGNADPVSDGSGGSGDDLELDSLDVSGLLNDVVKATLNVLGLNKDLGLSLSLLVNSTDCDGTSSSPSPLKTCLSKTGALVNQISLDSVLTTDSLGALVSQIVDLLDGCLGLDLGDATNHLLADVIDTTKQLLGATDQTLDLLHRCSCEGDDALAEAVKTLGLGLLNRRALVDLSLCASPTSNASPTDTTPADDLDVDASIGLGPIIEGILDSTTNLLGLNNVLQSTLTSLINTTSCGTSSPTSSPSSDPSLLSTCLSKTGDLVNQISLSALTDLGDLVTLVSQILDALQPCLLDSNTKDLLGDTYDATKQLLDEANQILASLETCGCGGDEKLISGVDSILASLGLRRRALNLDLCIDLRPISADVSIDLDNLAATLGLGSDPTAILNDTMNIVKLLGDIGLQYQSLVSYHCPSSIALCSGCLPKTINLTLALIDSPLDSPSSLEPLIPAANDLLDNLLNSCLGLDLHLGVAVNGTVALLGGIVDSTNQLLTTTENAVGLLGHCGCKNDKALVAGTKQVTASRKTPAWRR
ncbi:hypothetical protein C8J56DRAFT_394846 [Mycena floridula]|nr:hypothetical protein C8J56DRAFT_394846 [Mycena floridula]